MSHISDALSLDVRTDEAFESQVLADARLRLRQAHNRHSHTLARVASPLASRREKAQDRKWKQAASAVAVAAFGVGMLWPVASAPPRIAEPGLDAPRESRLVRVLPGEMLTLDAAAPRAR